MGYDALGVTTSIQHTNAGGSTLENFAYTLDIGERLSSQTDTINGTPTTTGYGYDLANQLTTAGPKTYNFDPNGNRNNSGFVVWPGNQLQSDGSYYWRVRSVNAKKVAGPWSRIRSFTQSWQTAPVA